MKGATALAFALSLSSKSLRNLSAIIKGFDIIVLDCIIIYYVLCILQAALCLLKTPVVELVTVM